jgi:ABC-type phosphate/phosphonate transport system substrate-binding protein
MRRRFITLAGLLVLLGTPTLAPAGETVKVGLTDTLVPGLSGTALQVAAAPFRVLLESGTGFKGRIVGSSDARTLARQLEEDKLQLGIFQGIEFAWARQVNPKLEPLVICVKQERTLKAYLIVRAAATYRKPAELRGTTLALPTGSLEHCTTFLRCQCLPDDSTAKRFYRKVLRTSDVEQALDDVLDGKAQAAVVDGLAWQSYRSSKPGCAKRLRVLLASETFPCAVIACQKGRFDAAEVKRFRERLIDARNNRLGRRLIEFFGISGFEAVPADYERLFRRVVKAYPPPPREG